MGTVIIILLLVLPMAASPEVFALGRKRESWLERAAAVVTGLELVLAVLLWRFPGACKVPEVLSLGLSFQADGFRRVYSLVTALLWFGTTLFSREYFRHEREHMASYWAFILLTLGAAQGVMLSADLMTTYVFFEILSLSSFPWVLQERTEDAIRAACTYLAVAVIGGLVLLMGLLLLSHETGTLTYALLPGALSSGDPGRLFAAGTCILLGFGAKAGMFPLHVWLPKAHPVAPAPASALLSGLLTKVGVFGILMTATSVFPASEAFGMLILTLGTVTMVLGAVLAVFSVNLKRTLACSSMSQIGFILVGIAAAVISGSHGSGDGTALALSGTVLHMVNHSMLKLVLFLAAGAAAMNRHTLLLRELRGWGRNKPLLKIPFGIAALGISGVPLLNGYLSKTLLHEGLLHAMEGPFAGMMRGVEVLFLISGGLTFAYMLRLYLCLFHQKNADDALQSRYDRKDRYLTGLSAGVLWAGAAVLLVLGFPPAAAALAGVMTGLPLHHFEPLAWENLRGALISLSVGGAVYLLLVRTLLVPEGRDRDLWPRWLDLEDRVYRPLLLTVLPGMLGRVARLFGENLLLRPLCRGLIFLGSLLGRAMDTGMDGLILLARGTFLREERVRDGSRRRRNTQLQTLRQATEEALGQVVDNFSYAMMMTCAGVVLILVLLVILLQR